MDKTAPAESGWREVAACAAAIALGIAILPFVGGSVLWTHPYWTDELCCTIYPAAHATSPIEVIANLAKRQDQAPPMLHLIVWTVGRVAGGMPPTLLRSIALCCTALALIFVYAALRQRFDRSASAAGALGVMAHPLVFTHAFEGRFYGPWLLFTAAFVWSLGRRDRFGSVMQAVSAVGVVTIHWFGIIVLTIIATAVAASHGRRWREAIRLLAPGTAGLVAFAVCVPLLIAQSAGTRTYSWIEPLSGSQLWATARTFYLATIPVVAALVVALSTALAATLGPSAAPSRFTEAARQPSVVALASLAVFPAALVVVSLVVQPSMLDRYAITTVLAWAPLVALAIEPLPRIGRVVALGALLFQLKPVVTTSIAARRNFAGQVASDTRAFERARQFGVPVLFPWLHSMYPVAGPTPHAVTPARMLDVPDAALAQLYPGDRLAWLRRRTRVEALSARSHTLVFGFPIVVSASDMDTVQRFVVMTSDLRVKGGVEQAANWGRIVFPRHTVQRIDDQVSLFVRK